jgi:hypothetical protein
MGGSMTDVLSYHSDSAFEFRLRCKFDGIQSQISFSGSVTGNGTVVTIEVMYAGRKGGEKGDAVQLNKSSRPQILLD